MMTGLFVSATCKGERCHCGQPAAKKVGEEIPFDDPEQHRHNLTAYVCARHYAELMGPVGAKQVGFTRTPDDGIVVVPDEPTEAIVREAYEEGVEDGIEWERDKYSEHPPQWIDSLARLAAIAAAAPKERARKP